MKKKKGKEKRNIANFFSLICLVAVIGVGADFGGCKTEGNEISKEEVTKQIGGEEVVGTTSGTVHTEVHKKVTKLEDLVSSWIGKGDEAKDKITCIALTGVKESAEAQATCEWEMYVEQCTDEKTISQLLEENGEAMIDERYQAYFVYNDRMARKLDEIAEKYGLKLHEPFIWVKPSNLEAYVGSKIINASYEKDEGYMYPNGNFILEGTILGERADNIFFTVQRSVKGYLDEAMLKTDNLSDYDIWEYQTKGGALVYLALGEHNGIIFADLEDAFVTVSIWEGTANAVTKSFAEQVADGILFAEIGSVKVDAGGEYWCKDAIIEELNLSEVKLNEDTNYYEDALTLSKFEIEQYADFVKSTVLCGSWEELAGEIVYPITIAGVKYKDAKEYLAADKSKWLSANFVNDLKNEDCKEMFSNWQGIMMGESGSIWIGEVLNKEYGRGELKIIAINVE